MDKIIKNFIENSKINSSDFSKILIEYSSLVNNKIPDNSIISFLIQNAILVDWEKALLTILQYKNISFYSLYNKEGDLIKRYF